MRELIYVSEAKLEQLVPALPGRPGRLRDVDAEVKTPLGGVKIGRAAQPPEPSLAAAVAALESSSRAPKWFADPAVRPGQWVHFEAPLSYGVTSGGEMVFFVDPNRPGSDYPTGRNLRLLLHGTASHLLGYPKVSVRWPNSNWSVENLHGFLRELRERGRQLDDNTAFDTGPSTGRTRSNLGERSAVMELSGLLRTENTAAWMAGYARVTAVFPDTQTEKELAVTVLTATPLYVEYVDPPGDALATT